MQKFKGGNFRITPVVCNVPNHYGECIQWLCLSHKCKQSSVVCFKCIDAHRQCNVELQDIETIQNKLIELRELHFNITLLQQKIYQLFKELLTAIEQILKPIEKFQITPNLINLNEIGQLMKGLPKEKIIKSTEITISQIKDILTNNNCEKIQKKENQKEDANYWYQKGDALFISNKYNEAIDCFDKAILLNPKDPNYWYRKGHALQLEIEATESINCDQTTQHKSNIRKFRQDKQYDNYNKAIHCYDKAIQINPQESIFLFQKGNALFLLSKYEEANYQFNKAIQIDPNNSNYWFKKGEGLQMLDLHNEAIDCYNKAIQLNPQEFKYWQQKGNALSNSHEYNESIYCYDKAIQLNSNDSKNWFEKGESLYMLNQFNEAIDCFDKAIQINPIESDYWYQKGITLQRIGRQAESIKCFQNLLQINPDHKGALDYFKYAINDSIIIYKN